MTSKRLISPEARSSFVIAIGTALVLTPMIVEVGTAAGITGAIVGILAIGLAISGTAPTGRGTLPADAHAAYDQGLGLGLALAAIAFLIAGDAAATLLFGGTALSQGLVSALTRYELRGNTTRATTA